MKTIKIFDIVALLDNISKNSLKKGQVGTVVEVLDDDVYEIEFSNNRGETIITTSVKASNLLVLEFDLVAV